jgi:hypothetical protein
VAAYQESICSHPLSSHYLWLPRLQAIAFLNWAYILK